jgi:hypothetical protein
MTASSSEAAWWLSRAHEKFMDFWRSVAVLVFE